MTGVEEMKRLDLFFKKSCSQLIPTDLVNDWLTSAVGLGQSIIDQVRTVMSRPH
jgi:hypothetical protein